ncbi:MAG: 2'-deoxycytidine 5'-triphosphate deaminase [Candidatus Liberibacter europaeus]|uniref:2'-deoxycytidine 5'-triphosphate deaminase n=1 Tax=Candidatus Liberibacter europaeus TaxID=744859 RepID=A0A2T4VYY2_9HYPH|nr:2'-deoxycytidine 5'-triphosphate deaminase [Candidatus Liberibacter europaeus]PTL86975.1 MAG: 2'-deoxycytidine 5'-triphosphate deaminase [Candidatus Liberibacter europaeus]
MNKGILPDKSIAELFEKKEIMSEFPLDEDQIQPASLDLRLSSKAYRVRASFLPNSEDLVLEKIHRFALHEIDISNGAVLESNCVYIVPLMERLNLKNDISAYVNPKSSTGRIDVFARVIVDRSQEFDRIPPGYCGQLYLEISPRTFPIIVRTGSRLSQLRLKYGCQFCSKDELLALHTKDPLIQLGKFSLSGEGVALSVDLKGENKDAIIGYRGKRHTSAIDVDSAGKYDVLDFWDPLYSQEECELVLDPNEFYILSSRESVRIPPFLVAEMMPYDPLIGEFRVHYAGFFDPGFGYEFIGKGARAVLEVRSHQVPFILGHGQIIGRLKYESMMKESKNLYGLGIGSHYQSQGLRLSKHFRGNNL